MLLVYQIPVICKRIKDHCTFLADYILLVTRWIITLEGGFFGKMICSFKDRPQFHENQPSQDLPDNELLGYLLWDLYCFLNVKKNKSFFLKEIEQS